MSGQRGSPQSTTKGLSKKLAAAINERNYQQNNNKTKKSQLLTWLINHLGTKGQHRQTTAQTKVQTKALKSNFEGRPPWTRGRQSFPFILVYLFRTFNITYVSLCHNLSLLHTITTLTHPHRYSCPHHATPHHRLCTSPGTANHASRPMGALDPREMVTIIRNTVGHRRLLELATEHVGNGVAPAPATMTAGGCTPNSRTSLTAIPPGALCVRSMGHTSPLCLQCSYARTNAHATTSYICRTACYSAAPSKTWIGCSVTRRRTTRSCDRTTPVFRRKTTNYGLVSHPWALPSPIQSLALL